ncbi:hypothetical protein POHY109586_04540 [Polaromonas hydrogenivorans]
MATFLDALADTRQQALWIIERHHIKDHLITQRLRVADKAQF